jgi:hypothetical protein
MDLVRQVSEIRSIRQASLGAMFEQVPYRKKSSDEPLLSRARGTGRRGIEGMLGADKCGGKPMVSQFSHD